jgi:hypothetical protein
MRQGNRRHFAIAVISIALVSEVCLASSDGDFEYWSKASVAFDIDKDWTLTFEEEFRLRDGGGNLYRHHSDLGLVYKSFADWIDFGFNYRQIFEKDSKGEWRPENRPHLNVTLKGRLFDLDLSDRSRLEYRDRENQTDVWRYRNMFSVISPLEFTELKLKPYLADEVFISLDGEGYNINRLYSGVSFKLTKSIGVGIYYLWQSTKSGSGWIDTNVIGTQVKFRF